MKQTENVAVLKRKIFRKLAEFLYKNNEEFTVTKNGTHIYKNIEFIQAYDEYFEKDTEVIMFSRIDFELNWKGKSNETN